MFLSAYRRFGRLKLTDAQADHYVREMATLARDLGMIDPPQSVAQLNAAILRFRSELRLSAAGAAARDFVARGVVQGPTQRAVYWLLVRSAFALLEPWESELLGVRARPVRNRLFIQPATWVLCRAIRLFVPPPPRTTS
jgi:uncharacterized protein (DUF2236 family)